MKAMRSGQRAITARSWVRKLAGASAVAMILSTVAAVGPDGSAALAFNTYPAPAITVADGNTVIAVQTSEDGLRFYWNQFGTNNWYGEQVAANGTTFSPPTMVQDGNAVIIAAVGPKDSLDFYWAQNGTSTWNAETIAGAWSTYSAPSMAVDGNTVNIAAEGPNNSLTFYWAFNGSPTWGPETVAGPGTTYSAPSLAVNGGGVNIAAEGPSNSLDFYWALNGSATWGPETVAGPGTTFSAPAITGNDGYANIAAEGPSNSLDFYWQKNDTTPWYPETVPDTSGSVVSAPSIVAYNFEDLDWAGIAYQAGVLDSLVYAMNAQGSSVWPLDAVNTATPDWFLAASPVAVTVNDYMVNIAAFGVSGQLYFYWTDGSSGTWHQELVAPGTAD
jgi:hypothetical protein